MLYRLYQPADFAALYTLEELCFQPPIRYSRAWMRQLIANPNSATWIAEDSAGENKTMAGFAIVEWTTMPKGTVAYIQTIEVHPSSRRRGIAAQLLKRAEDSARAAGAIAIWLHVDVENPVAIHLYEGRGYARKGREEHYYARHRPAFVYSKSLGPPVQ
ncbi:MAG: GNAT family N-acetyltransferase [Terracidiphilus sp.]|jgi:ribosomal protein S18 acetylase RimI-like enzyme